ncbi:ABC transporter substrate-binding protein [Sulfurimonas sp.]|uniref:ABC transporter substrate-binding protein n=1 Tax=Sulfurimonas sp. TaxID=2022749 RepID=UPI0025E1107D|nr:ABC transporter substrate-binding protein [Sulfurimonas sp.]
MYKYLITIFIVLIVLYASLRDERFESKNIELGISIPRTGIMKAWGDAVYSGANAYFSHANQNRLLKDKEIKVVVFDDKYEPELTIENVKKLINKNVFAFFGFVGTPTVKKILPIIQKTDIPLIAPFTGASFLRDENIENLVNFRSSYDQEINNAVDYLHYKKNISRFAVFYQNDDYGEEGFVSLLLKLRSMGLKIHGEGTYKRNTLSIRHAFHEIKSAKPEVVFMIGAYKANALFIKTAKKDPTFKNTIFCNISFGEANEMVKELDYKTDNLLFSQVVPSYQDTSIPVILEYKKMMSRYFPKQPLGFISLESYLSAKAVVSALKNVKGTLTREKFLRQIEHPRKNSLEGVEISYKNKQLHNKVYLFKYKNSKFIEVDNEY